MKRRNISILASMLVLLVLLSLGGGFARAQGENPPEKLTDVTITASTVGNGFTYQGTLKTNGAPANGNYDFRFDLLDGPAGESVLGASYLYVSNIPVVNGLFTAKLDFSTINGSNYFTGDARWLQATVRPAGSGTYIGLYPAQELTAVPYAISLMPGATIKGTPYQTLKVQNYYPTTGVPAAISGEIYSSTDGAGVNGYNYISTAGATGVGVWGRTNSPDGAGVLGNGYNGATGVHGVANTVGGIGVWGENITVSNHAIGVFGLADNSSCSYNSQTWGCIGVLGDSDKGVGVYGQTTSGVGVSAVSSTGVGLRVESQSGDIIQAYTGPSSEALRFEVTNAGEVYAHGAFHASGIDVAEVIPASGILQPGDVVEIDPNTSGQFRLAATPNSTLVAGVISTQPGMLLGAGDPDEDGNTGPQLALAGRVPVKVSAENGAIHPGDLLVASSTPGYAMRAPANPAPGTVIGKALGKLDSGTGLIDMLVMLR
jgi:hypothetical protein